MDEKLLKVLNLAFNKTASENEAVAAFHAAKRLLNGKPISDFLGKEVERVVYRDRNSRDRMKSWELRFPKRFHLSLIENMINDAANGDLLLRITKFKMEDTTYYMDIKVEGSASALIAFDNNLDYYFEQMKAKNTVADKPKQAYNPPKSEAPKAPKPKDKPKTSENKDGFWKSLAKGIFS